MVKHKHFKSFLNKGWVLGLGIILTACLSLPTPTVPVIYLRTPLAGITSPTPFQPHGTQTPTPPDPPTETPTPADSATPNPTPTLAVIAARIPIIEYHYSQFAMGDQVMMKTAWFEDQIAWLADNGFITLSAADLVIYLNGGSFPVKSVILSFDLGTARRDDFANVIIPTLKQHGFKALFFLLANNGVITDTCDSSGKFCWDDLRQWQLEGIVSVESHGLTHPNYGTLTTAQMRWDAGQAYQIIGDKLGIFPLGFAYPYDSIPSQAPKVIESLGYQFAVGGFSRKDRSVHLEDSDRFILPRVYPYSNPAIYPVIGGSNGKTYGELVMSSIERLGGSLTPTVTRTPTRTKILSVTPKK
jgi:peptidoglycan/xylan/chitin deacetylase (PgdA/CDA1 family)